MFPQARVVPFGSSVNSYGMASSDLDMVVKLEWTGVMGNCSLDNLNNGEKLVSHNSNQM